MKQYVVYFKLGNFPELFNITISANNFKEALNIVREKHIRLLQNFRN